MATENCTLLVPHLTPSLSRFQPRTHVSGPARSWCRCTARTRSARRGCAGCPLVGRSGGLPGNSSSRPPVPHLLLTGGVPFQFASRRTVAGTVGRLWKIGTRMFLEWAADRLGLVVRSSRRLRRRWGLPSARAHRGLWGF